MIVLSSKYVNRREKCAEESKTLCRCLARRCVFCGLVEQGQKWQKQGALLLVPQNHWTIIKFVIMLKGKKRWSCC